MGLLEEYIRGLLLEAGFDTFSNIAARISKASGIEGGVTIYKKGSGTGHVRLAVAKESEGGDPAKAKALQDKDREDILRRAGYDVVGVIPKGARPEISQAFPVFKIVPKGAKFADPIPVVFGGAERIGAEKIAIDGIAEQLKGLIPEDDSSILISPDPTSEIRELRRPRWVKSISKVSGTPKADAKMMGAMDDRDDIYLSLKGGTEAKHHQQWSGFTQFSNKRIIRDFAKRILNASQIKDGAIHLPRGEDAAVPFHHGLGLSPDEFELKIMSVYGPNAFPINDSGFGIDKVHLVLQAPVPDVSLVAPDVDEALRKDFVELSKLPDQKIYTLLGAHKVSYPNIPQGSYEPVLHARYDSSSPLKIGQFVDARFLEDIGLDPKKSAKGVRFLIYPKDKLPKSSKDITTYELEPLARAGAVGDPDDLIPQKVPQLDAVTEAALREYIRYLLS